MKDDCEFCQNKFEHAAVKEYNYWVVQLFLNQKYLGRSLIKLKEHKVDLTDLNQSERKELFEEVLPELKEAIDNVFDPDLYNQATLGNDCRHFHLHFIPRYKTKRKFNGKEFEDDNWNSHYKNGNSLELSEKRFKEIKKALTQEIS
jgi:diadenosine tetraphosphate (Ap4A) HIT family hydrolase